MVSIRSRPVVPTIDPRTPGSDPVIGFPSIKQNEIFLLLDFILRFQIDDMRILIDPGTEYAAQIVDYMQFGESPGGFTKLLHCQPHPQPVMPKPSVANTVFRPILIEKDVDLVCEPSEDSQRMLSMLFVVHG